MPFFRSRSFVRLLRLAIPSVLVISATLLGLATQRLASANQSAFPLVLTPRFDPEFGRSLALPTAASSRLAEARVPLEFSLRRGETVVDLVDRLGLDGVEAHRAQSEIARLLDVRRLRAGDRYSAFFNSDSSLDSLEIGVHGDGRFEMRRAKGTWRGEWHPFVRSVVTRTIQGEVEGSLDGSIRKAGGPSGLASRFASILQWDVDFSRDIRRGDRFAALYDEVQLDGKPHAIGMVHAVTWQGRGAKKEAIRFGESGTYYDPEGRPLRKMFLRSPLRYSRVTSAFSQRRFHPVLRVFRPHYGIDYGAPVGTPVQVTANGTVEFTGWDRGGGRVVKVRHGGGYRTAYLHLSRFATGIRPGVRVKQGDIIAYTGMTGLASGPHLDYRVQLNNRWIDPQSLRSVQDDGLSRSQLASFRSWRSDVLVAMDGGDTSRLKFPAEGGLQGDSWATNRTAPPPAAAVRAR
jgi:murein DD-endopeptidase MepM/ murein hydrolase activator NlpD